tara:strand:+ start:206 stop:499 length:294 start_codon:yes stop_codon:yes gene_type:complete
MGREDSFFKPALIVDFRGIVRRLLANSSTGMPREDAEQLLLRELKAVSADAKDQGFADAEAAEAAAGEPNAGDLMSSAINRFVKPAADESQMEEPET